MSARPKPPPFNVGDPVEITGHNCRHLFSGADWYITSKRRGGRLGWLVTINDRTGRYVPLTDFRAQYVTIVPGVIDNAVRPDGRAPQNEAAL